jgi:S-adenosylmethionine hydrolase
VYFGIGGESLQKIMTFLTDFGTKEGYVAQLKGVALSITDAQLVDITHDISPQNIYEGAFALRFTVPSFPVGTVHVAVVDPGVGTERRGIIVTAKDHILVGPDNGLLIPTARFLGDFTVYEITNREYMSQMISPTSHGRDIFIPVAAHILKGVPFEKFGKIITDFVELDFKAAQITGKTAIGEILAIDHFGNAITNISGNEIKKVLPYGKKIALIIGNKKREMLFHKAYNFVKKGQFLTTISSSNLLEIGLNQGNAAQKLKIKPGDKVKIIFS